MVELDGSTPLHASLLRGSSVESAGQRRRGVSIARRLARRGRRATLARRWAALCLMSRSLGIEGCSKTLGLVEDAARVLNGSAECGVRAFDAVLRLLLPVASPLAKDGVRSSGRRMTCISLGAATSDGLDGGAHGRGDADSVRVIARATLNPVARGQKGVETLNEVGVSGKELGNAVDYTRGVDSAKSLGPENQL